MVASRSLPVHGNLLSIPVGVLSCLADRDTNVLAIFARVRLRQLGPVTIDARRRALHL